MQLRKTLTTHYIITEKWLTNSTHTLFENYAKLFKEQNAIKGRMLYMKLPLTLLLMFVVLFPATYVQAQDGLQGRVMYCVQEDAFRHTDYWVFEPDMYTNNQDIAYDVYIVETLFEQNTRLCSRIVLVGDIVYYQTGSRVQLFDKADFESRWRHSSDCLASIPLTSQSTISSLPAQFVGSADAEGYVLPERLMLAPVIGDFDDFPVLDPVDGYRPFSSGKNWQNYSWGVRFQVSASVLDDMFDVGNKPYVGLSYFDDIHFNPIVAYIKTGLPDHIVVDTSDRGGGGQPQLQFEHGVMVFKNTENSFLVRMDFLWDTQTDALDVMLEVISPAYGAGANPPGGALGAGVSGPANNPNAPTDWIPAVPGIRSEDYGFDLLQRDPDRISNSCQQDMAISLQDEYLVREWAVDRRGNVIEPAYEELWWAPLCSFPIPPWEVD